MYKEEKAYRQEQEHVLQAMRKSTDTIRKKIKKTLKKKINPAKPKIKRTINHGVQVGEKIAKKSMNAGIKTMSKAADMGVDVISNMASAPTMGAGVVVREGIKQAKNIAIQANEAKQFAEKAIDIADKMLDTTENVSSHAFSMSMSMWDDD